MMKQIEVADIQKIYEEGSVRVHAVKGVTLSVDAGELVLLMGPSGSGKTTLLSMMGCILKPTKGSLRIMGEEVINWNENSLPLTRRRHIGFIFQHFNLLSALTALENVEVSLNLKGIKGKEGNRIARDLLEQVGLGDRCDFLPMDLSGGEKQRVSIARALAGKPSIILADEPTGNLDSQTGRKVIELIKQLAVKESKSIVIVTHDSRITDLADRIYHIEDGILTNGYRSL
ncbi:MAG TPA: ABC transporter ATP-binding protein [Thermodesulfobacteriota bacterium]|nr:ABC transporter ATP-binding protein [Thermodesulfobacteriota bacterium]